ncbi:MAG: tRNA pseudouridine(55) synthase TruB [Firmicutes bacterium]|nr:tRNA pseudouridine(55) synthase TruB [Bacillota bacterium]
MRHGFLVLNKERGLTSHQAVARLRRIFGQSEAGHSGTLDPGATGVLVVGLGQATRFFPFLDERQKVYRAEIILGQVTDTQDAYGQIIREQREFIIGRDRLDQAVAHFTGEQDQVPPMFSAVKVGGQKLYDLARQGLEIKRQARRITVYCWEILSPQDCFAFRDKFTCEITCSRGTYIRTLIHDLGEFLGCGAHMGGLIRLASGDFKLETAVTLAQVEEYSQQGRLEELLVPLNTALRHLPSIQVEPEDVPKVRNGGKLSARKYKLPESLSCAEALFEREAHPEVKAASDGENRLGSLARVLDPCARLIAVAELKAVASHPYWQPVKVLKEFN